MTFGAERSGVNPVVIIEGVDYSGKSTLSAEVAAALDGVVIRPIPMELSKVRDLVEEHCNVDERYSFFIASSFLTYERVKGVLVKKNPVVIDRWMLSTNKHHELLGVNTDLILPKDQIPRSEFMFFTSVSYQEWEKRRTARGIKGVDDHLITNDFMSEVNDFLRSEGLIEINTDTMSVDESVDLILERIRDSKVDFSNGSLFLF